MSIKLKRAYDKPSKDDGQRILVERLWPRGLTKEKAEIGLWMKEIAPSGELRKWYNHEMSKWPEFKKRYMKELKGKKELFSALAAMAGMTVTFVYAASDENHNSALVLKELIEKMSSNG